MKMKGHLDVREAVKTAKECVNEIFADENIRSPRLEEVAFDETGQVWKVTVSFHRPSVLGALAEHRTFKVVQINDRTGYIVSVTHRLFGSEKSFLEPLEVVSESVCAKRQTAQE